MKLRILGYRSNIEIVRGSLLFSAYLLENASISRNANRDYLMSRTAIQYLSAIGEFAQKKF